MKLINLGICIDNADPLAMGRIRCIKINEGVDEKEGALEYEAYSDLDPFVCNPFLPQMINIIPQVGQSVKIISYDVDKPNTNQEYIIGQTNTLSDTQNNTYTQQITNTSFGGGNVKNPSVFDENGNYRDSKTEGFFHKKEDSGFYGKKGSDMLFVEDGIVLRGGKLKSENKMTPKEKVKNIHNPQMSNKLCSFQIKKFPFRFERKTEEVKVTQTPEKQVSHVVEYEIDDVTNPKKIGFKIYSVKNGGEKFNSKNLTQSTTFDPSQTIEAEFEIEVEDKRSCIQEINRVLYKFYIGQKINNISVDFPFYFRPNKGLLTNTNPNKVEILNKVKIVNKSTVFGLVWEKGSVEPSIGVSNNVVEKLIADNDKDITISSLISDSIYLLSTETKGVNPIDFNKIDNYQISQESYFKNIDPNTYSLVRGEVLIKLLRSIVDVILTHEHNVIGPMVQNNNYEKYNELMRNMNNIENELINNNLKIN